MSRALNWILLVIVALVSAGIAESSVAAVFDALDGRPYRVAPHLTQKMASAFLSGLAFTLVPTLISKQPRRVALVIFAIGALWRTVPITYMLFAYPYLRQRASGEIGAIAGPIAAGMIGGAAALLMAQWKVRRLNATHSDRSV